MSDLMTLSVKEARSLIYKALTGVGTAPRNAHYFSEAILDTELSGLEGHGFHWLPYYCLHVKSGKIDGKARPKVKKITPTAFMVDAKGGFAHPAIEKGFEKLVPAAEKFGIAAMGVAHSYNAATLGYHTGTLAKQGLLALGFTNSIAAIAPFGGKKPIIGTNPMSFAVPGRRGKIRFLIDQSSSHVAWTAVKRAQEDGRKIPLGWALDKDGKPTTDPVKGLEGSMAPSGGFKGFGQGLIVEVLCAAMTGSALGPRWVHSPKPMMCRSTMVNFLSHCLPKRSGQNFSMRSSTILSKTSSRKKARGFPIRAARPITRNWRKRGFLSPAIFTNAL